MRNDEKFSSFCFDFSAMQIDEKFNQLKFILDFSAFDALGNFKIRILIRFDGNAKILKKEIKILLRCIFKNRTGKS